MLRIREYSRLAPGTTFMGNEVKVCPHCGKVGMLEKESGTNFYVHSETTGVDEQGDIVLQYIQCPNEFSLVGEAQDLITRALANLTSMRDNIPPGYVHEASFYKTFNLALRQLETAGVNVSDWRLSDTRVGETDASEFRAKIDAVSMYFASLRRGNPGIGFRQ